MQIYGQVYLLTNKVNGKQYVGQTILPVVKRWTNHKADARSRRNPCRALGHAIRKYGPDAFTVETLVTAKAQEQLNHLEVHWISKLGCLTPNGYNISSGGRGGGSPSAETRRKISKAQLGVPKLGHPHTERTKKRIGDAQRGVKKHSQQNTSSNARWPYVERATPTSERKCPKRRNVKFQSPRRAQK